MDDNESFDPRSWVTKNKPERQGDPQSFDPRSWIADEKGASAGAPMPEKDRRSPRPAVMIGGAAVAVLAGLGVTMWHRTPPSQPAVAASPTADARTKAAPVKGGLGQSTRTLMIAGPAALPAALVSAGLSAADAQAAAAAAAPGITSRSGQLRVAMTLQRVGGQDQLVRMEVAFDDSAGAVVTRGPDGGYQAKIQAASLDAQVCTASGEMDGDNFYSSAVAAGVPDTLIEEIAKALSFDFDFSREVDKGDTFEISYRQSFNRAGKPVGIPSLEFVRLTTKEKSATLYAFTPPGGQPGWYDGNGTSTVRALMRTPIDGARVSSKFGMRMHPILHIEKMHKGVDFAAPIGTPIYAAGDGVILAAVLTPTEGRMIKIKHDNGWITLYMHMSKIMDNITVGMRVPQGMQIGEVGTTGRSTGPHLHYQLEINGEVTDPLSLPMGDSKPPLAGPARDAFVKQRDKVDASRSGSTRC